MSLELHSDSHLWTDVGLCNASNEGGIKPTARLHFVALSTTCVGADKAYKERCGYGSVCDSDTAELGGAKGIRSPTRQCLR